MNMSDGKENSDGTVSPSRILLIEDHFDRHINTLIALLKLKGLVVDVVPSTKQALPRMRAQRPDVLIISNKTPGPAESELVSLLRLDSQLSDLPIIVLHHNHSPEDRTWGDPLREGVQILKPSNPQEVWSVAKRILEKPQKDNAL
jgi:CheY-like chemotaxis protein